MKRIIIFSAVVFLAVAAVILSCKMYDNHIFYEYKVANSNAKIAYNILNEWCEHNKTEISALADEYRDGITIDVSADGEGFVHFLYEEMNKKHGITNGYVYIGVGDKDSSEVVFTQWSKKTKGEAAGQYHDGQFINEYGVKKIEFGSFFKREGGA